MVLPSSESPSTPVTMSPAEQPGLLGRGAGEDLDDAQPAVGVDGLAATPGRVLGGHHRADALELAASIVERGFELVGAHVARVRVLEHLEHALDGALEHGCSGSGCADVLVGDVR